MTDQTNNLNNLQLSESMHLLGLLTRAWVRRSYRNSYDSKAATSWKAFPVWVIASKYWNSGGHYTNCTLLVKLESVCHFMKPAAYVLLLDSEELLSTVTGKAE